jgi:choline dehydrogenase-like flavoprotein
VERDAELYDVVVVGAGVAGALIAYRAAKQRARVLVLEAGASVDRREAVGLYGAAPVVNGFKALGAAYAEAGAEGPEHGDQYYVQSGPENFPSTYERVAGGSTWHWLGHTPRLLPSDFKLYSKYAVGRDWPIGYDDLEPWYCQAEAELGVAGDDVEWQNLHGAFRSKRFPLSKIWPSVADTFVAGRLHGVTISGEEIHVLSTPSARNSAPYDGRPPCAGNSTCVPLCPIGAKYDASVHVEKARALGVEVRERCIVTKLVADAGGRIAAVRFHGPNGPAEVRGKLVVVAAHAIESARLLLLSGVANSSDQVGRNVMDHLQRAILGTAPEPIYPFRGPPATSGIETFRDGPFRAKHAAFRFSVGNDGWSRTGSPFTELREAVLNDGLFGAPLVARLREQVQGQMRMSCSTEMLPDPDNRVTADGPPDALGQPRPRFTFKAAQYTRDALDRAMVVAAEIYSAAGVTVPVPPDPVKYSGAGHIMGTCRMGEDQASSVVDANSRSHDHSNLYIVGASTFPATGTANPTLTVAALALRASETIIHELQHV